MDTNMMFSYIQSYGYIMIFLFIFCGIVGIPAPEESLLFFLGVLVSQKQLEWSYCFLISWFGATMGMITGYGIGRYFGHPFMKKYGKYVGIKAEKWERANELFRKYGKWLVLFGFYLPGVRQIVPYMSGMIHFPFLLFSLLACIGALLWTVPIMLLGMLLGRHMHIPLASIPLIGLALFLLFLAVMWIKHVLSKKQFEN
ncbi:DedA family protein [Anoxybacillus rupiensis]|jgi:membrane protein DedA with SNARE-associated domain|uniref:DedA family protein n=1 Tax=Anoxybacteroides rupiense TaxID=311460 RepID=A0ABD5IW23_9BACL|nr:MULTISPECIES: DedA family protein [Anoxybacillus]KXG09533.1 putative membrane protein [Anoxybacillus sp. P3H1B]MBB3908895.1 membrane protein DedA with SNARE-associated domain [Anoxybacillus rupiensis]MBS2771875.1 DedA family protein [Anoxybacillus rupiensis]MDE8565519.1 DedA family protein [Anoxybacillus rupiensis]MED5052527.1 DedA family protein [Anoxybacillus rupiensis]